MQLGYISDGPACRRVDSHIALSATLARQALGVVMLSECTGWINPMEIDIGGRKAGESAYSQESGPHGVTWDA